MFIWNAWPQFFRRVRTFRDGYHEEACLDRLHRLILHAELSREEPVPLNIDGRGDQLPKTRDDPLLGGRNLTLVP